jgi:hypothetical protein
MKLPWLGPRNKDFQGTPSDSKAEGPFPGRLG